ARRPGVALIGAAIGAVAGVEFVALVAWLSYSAWVWWASVNGGMDGIIGVMIAVIVTFFAALAAVPIGLIGCLLGARLGEVRQPRVESAMEDTWTAPDTAEVQRVVAGRVMEQKTGVS